VTGLLLDTHVVLWAVSVPSNLRPEVTARLVGGEFPVYFSLASAWELAVKSGRGKIRLPMDVYRFTEAIVEQLAAEWLPISLDHVARVESLPFHHADPFDRLLVAQALCNGLRLVTANDALRESGAKILPARGL
jgi:PIN domain nuclease of toxin-antitoxin system